MVRTRAREGITGLVRALRGRWLSSRRWLCETVVWACDDPWPKWECINPFADMDSTGLDAQEPAWPDTEIRAFTLAAASEPLPLEQLPSMERYPGLDYSTCVIEPGKAAYARHANGADASGVYTVGDPQ